ncbi:hypothetical protein MHM87_04675 [Alteromonas sp. Cnat3-28]|uniref:hypothetical protein n=1 Tax=Alteromonas sp. Cnat3-28 TaxID=2917729 RepID=UPI001EF73CD5|nr:hypothetical protein [Alteromonas sp. Cnat3-28]MCG7644880.1 hypothetical protein [Alteromonas sp. Cnat3-28]
MEKLSRRKLLTGTAKVAPLLALASTKSVWASGCLSPSGALSNNFSNVSYSCAGRQGATPGFWKNHVECWPSGIFAGLMLFKDEKFGVVWDWTQGTTSKLMGNRFYLGWSRSIESAESSNYGSYATSWSKLGDMCPRFVKNNTIWESLTGKYAGGEKEAEYHLAAALLNAMHPEVEYGYDVFHLLDYCKKAEQHSDPKVFDRFVSSLVELNERGGIEAPNLATYDSDDLVMCYSPGLTPSEGLADLESDVITDSSTKRSGRKGKGKKAQENDSEDLSVDASDILGGKSDYPMFQSAL